MKLVILDLDQTLADFINIYDEAMAELFRKSFGVSARLTEIDFAGRALTDSFVRLAKLKGIDESRVTGQSRELLEEFERLFIQSVPEDSSRFVLPGARELLEALSETDNVVALYTGSSRGIVEKVLAATGLSKYFKFCRYGTEVKKRADMVKEAVEWAERLTGRKFRDKDVVVIGDSVRDIEAGEAFNALTIAVATGFHTPEQLASHHPDYLFPSLKDWNKVLRAIG